MPSSLHQAIVELLREHLSLIPRVLDRVGVPLPSHATTHVADVRSTFSEVAPAEYAADLVVDVGSSDRLSLIVEVQLRHDPDKAGSWPIYVAHRWQQTGRPVLLVVVTLDRATERRCRRPIVLMPPYAGSPGMVLTPTVLGPSNVPLIVDRAESQAHPELALLSTVVHGRDARRVVPIAEATLEALEMRGDLDRGRLWIDLMLAALAPPAAAALEAGDDPDIRLHQRDLSTPGRRSGGARRSSR